MVEFGARVDGVAYIEILGAYAVIADERGNVALLRTPRGYFLPGGGMEPGEDAEVALMREVREELGCTARILGKIGVAAQYLHAPDERRYVKKVGHFYVAALGRKVAEPTEADHVLAWHEPAEAASMLTQAFQCWAVREAFQVSRPASRR